MQVCYAFILLFCMMGVSGGIAQDGVVENTTAVTDLAYDPVLLEWRSLDIEERAAYSEQWIGEVEEELAVNPGYRGLHYYETRHVYGIPDEENITEETARQLAWDAIEQTFGELGVEENLVYADVYFDMTDPQRDLWKFYFAVDELDPWRFFWVEVDGMTGEVVTLKERDQFMEYYDLM